MKKYYHPVLKNLRVMDHEDSDATYYATKEMLNDGIFIKEAFTYDDNDKPFAAIWLIYLSRSDHQAGIITLHEGDPLSPLQLYMMLKTVLDLYEENALSDFLMMMEELSISFTSTEIQNENHLIHELLLGISKELDILESLF